MTTPQIAITVSFCVALIALPIAQSDPQPSARLISAPRFTLPDDVDSNAPMTWDLVEGSWRLFAFASWGGVPSLLTGRDLSSLRRVVDSVTFVPHPGHGVWIEAVIPDDQGTWYGYYHHEVPAEACGRTDRSITRIGAAKSTDRGRTWEDLGPILEAPPGTYACSSSNRYVLGGVGDVSALLDADHRDLYLFYSEYGRDRNTQGVAIARLAWADRDRPRGRVSVWRDGIWLRRFTFGTPLVMVAQPWHDGDQGVDAYWGPSVHWNTYLERYVMLLNRARNENFDNEGIYVSYSQTLGDPRAWSAPRKLMNGGGWYPQVVGLDAGAGTDKHAGQRARFFLTGKSEYWIEFSR